MALLARHPGAAFAVAVSALFAGQSRWSDVAYSGAKLVLAKAVERRTAEEVEPAACEVCPPCAAVNLEPEEDLRCETGMMEHGAWGYTALAEGIFMAMVWLR